MVGVGHRVAFRLGDTDCLENWRGPGHRRAAKPANHPSSGRPKAWASRCGRLVYSCWIRVSGAPELVHDTAGYTRFFYYLEEK